MFFSHREQREEKNYARMWGMCTNKNASSDYWMKEHSTKNG
jgi:hypothetical protein